MAKTNTGQTADEILNKYRQKIGSTSASTTTTNATPVNAITYNNNGSYYTGDIRRGNPVAPQNYVDNTPKTDETPQTPTYAAPQSSYQDELTKLYKTRADEARNSALNAIQQRLNTGLGMYEQQLGNVNDQYQALINQNEVDRYKSKASIRESLANRGQLDSGYGRQEALNMQTRYGNATNNIKLQREAARNDIQNLIAQLKAEAEAEKAAINNSYNQNLLSLMASL